MVEFEIREYTENNRAYFSEWLEGLDRVVRARVRTRIDRVARGNMGDTKSVGDGVFELRLDFGPGYRVYFGREGHEVIILLLGGNKDSQARDIQRAKELWNGINRRVQHGYQKLQRDTS